MLFIIFVFGILLVLRSVRTELKIEVMKEGLLDLKTTILKTPNITEFTGSADEPYIAGTSGELLPFSPIDGCSELKESDSFTKRDEKTNKPRFSTVNGKSEQVIVLMTRGGCSFNAKFQNAKKIKGVVGVLIYNEVQDTLPGSGTIDLTNTSDDLPGFLISNSLGLELYNKMTKYRGSSSSSNSTSSNIPYIEITMTPGSMDATNKADSMIQIALIAIIIILALSFGASIVVHMRSPQMPNSSRNNNNQQQPSLPIDVEFLQKLPLKTYKGRRKSTDSSRNSNTSTSSKNGYKTMGHSGIKSPIINDEKDKAAMSPEAKANDNNEWFDMIEHDWPMNDSCPICLDEFNSNEVLNELPCGHCYHIACIQPWLQYRSACCPLCKLDVREEFKPGCVNVKAAGEEDETRSKLRSIWNKLILKSSRTDVPPTGTVITTTSPTNRSTPDTSISMSELQEFQIIQVPQRALVHESSENSKNIRNSFQSVPL